MNRYLIIGLIASGIIGSIIGTLYVIDKQDVVEESPPEFKTGRIFSGPFSIDKSQYRLGDNIFMTVDGIPPHLKGQILFVKPNSKVHITLPFDSSKKDSFNYYFRPDLSIAKGICTKGDLIGNWKIVFEGTPYFPINFEIINKTIIGMEKIYSEKRC